MCLRVRFYGTRYCLLPCCSSTLTARVRRLRSRNSWRDCPSSFQNCSILRQCAGRSLLHCQIYLDKLRSDVDERPGKRTVLKLKLYKHINNKIREIYPDFNIGISTPLKEESDRWFQIYRHWSFKPKHHIRNLTRTKRAKK